MYKKPSKRAQRLRLFALYSVMTFTVIAVVAVLVLVVSNYRINRETGTLEQRGLVQFASTPSGAYVTVDGTVLSSRTATKHSVEPGEHSFSVTRDGYEPWNLTTSVSAGSLVWLNYVRLVPTDRTNQVMNTYSTVAATSPSPDGKSILLQYDKMQPVFRLVDISRDQPSGKDITLSSDIFDEPTEGQVPEFSFGSWDEGGRYILLRHTLGDKTDIIVVDTHNPDRSVNISREFSLPITQAVLSGRSGNILYIVAEGSLRKVDVSGGTVSRSLVGNVEKFSLYDTNTIAYVALTHTDGTDLRVAGIYHEGDDAPTVLRTTNRDTSLSIATSTYYGSTYTAIAEDGKLTIYKGHYDQGFEGLTRVSGRSLPDTVTHVEFTDTGSYVLARSETSFTSFGLERQIFTTVDLPVPSQGLYWLDTMHLGLFVDGKMTMRNIDGTNVHNLTASKAGYRGVLSRNGTYFYSIGDTENSEGVRLQRFRMILR